MRLKIKKRDLVVGGLVLVFIIPIVYAATSAVEKGFGVELWISNIGPTIMWDNGTSYNITAGIDPTSGSTTLVWFVFNVTDDNGEDDINETWMYFNISLGVLGSGPRRANATCVNVSKRTTENRVVFNCSVKMWYYDNTSSDWVINATAEDLAGTTTTNDSQLVTYNELSAMTMPVAWINFTSVALGASNQAATNPIILNNTGNDDFDQINITAAALIGMTTSGETIAASQFVLNYTNLNTPAGSGLPLSNAAQVIPGVDSTANLTLMHGHSSAETDYNDYTDDVIAAKGNQSLWFWVDVPSSGLSQQGYNNTWNITVIDLS